MRTAGSALEIAWQRLVSFNMGTGTGDGGAGRGEVERTCTLPRLPEGYGPKEQDSPGPRTCDRGLGHLMWRRRKAPRAASQGPLHSSASALLLSGGSHWRASEGCCGGRAAGSAAAWSWAAAGGRPSHKDRLVPRRKAPRSVTKPLPVTNMGRDSRQTSGPSMAALCAGNRQPGVRGKTMFGLCGLAFQGRRSGGARTCMTLSD